VKSLHDPVAVGEAEARLHALRPDADATIP
jgi:hypothetical protein